MSDLVRRQRGLEINMACGHRLVLPDDPERRACRYCLRHSEKAPHHEPRGEEVFVWGGLRNHRAIGCCTFHVDDAAAELGIDAPVTCPACAATGAETDTGAKR